MPDTKGRYSLEEIRIGFERFNKEVGHYPAAFELDNCPYLPSARQTQRRFGGLPNLKKDLGIKDVHYGRGKFRSAICTAGNKIGFQAERDLEKVLISHFGEPFVHIEKPISKDGKKRFDFFVYAKDIKFGIDVFYSETKKNIQINVNSKIDSYKDVDDVMIYFVMANKSIDQKMLDEIVESKPNKPLLGNTRLVAMDTFLSIISTIKPYL